ncbi:lactonase family protein [Paenibacillus glucanolyticus]|uniref:lactonase family protein n=1 Tax=Paenibacillus glucanolyticus TaxID=59843 RepID=UPI00128C8B22|nr:lactonase family protein [Paenibacillus glucanolyticus]MPY18237.1 lactonase family protein [Paenibacillus glucanolyticus]
MANRSQRTLLFTGAYAEEDQSGVCIYEFNEDSGELKLLDEVSGIKNPTFLNVDAVNRRLYAIGEMAEQGGKAGEVVSFEIDPAAGKLIERNRVRSVSSSTCHIQRDESSKYLIVSSYHGGLVGLLSIDEEGLAGELLDEKKHSDLVPVREAQQARAHSAFYSPDGKYVFVQDLGLDKILSYTINPDTNELSFHDETQLEEGVGPRHLAFHPSGVYAYVINELNSSVTVLRYIQDEGRLAVLETISTLPVDFDGESYCAEIAVSEDGKTVYGSNRGHDSIVVFSVHEDTGYLSPVQYISTEGGHPRHFTLMPGGKFMVVANRDGNNLVLFNVDPEDGKLAFTGYTVSQSKPVCVKPAVFQL